MNDKLKYFSEPKLQFGFNQSIEDPRDGLLLFGANEKFESSSVHAGVIGTSEGINLYKSFVNIITSPILSDSIQRPSFPGFESVFSVKWNHIPEISKTIEMKDIRKHLFTSSIRLGTSRLVNLYIAQIKDIIENEDIRPNIYFIVVPLEVYKKCRPGKNKDISDNSVRKFKESQEIGQISLAYDENKEYEDTMKELIESSSDFHHLLKARLIQEEIEAPIQIILENTLAFKDKRNQSYSDDMKAFLAWSISTTIYYKLGKVPWKLSEIRPKVCYLGLVFKQLNDIKNKSQVCSAAQMFLDSGDGSVFKGTVGDFKTDKNEYHLKKKDAKKLLELALNYYERDYGSFPEELFIHGRAKFHNEEWDGFCEALKERECKTKIVGVVIKDTSQKLKIFRDAVDETCDYGNLRGLAYKINDREGYLWTRGFVTRLNTSLSKEIANPLRIMIDKGEVELEIAMRDILALTKVV